MVNEGGIVVGAEKQGRRIRWLRIRDVTAKTGTGRTWIYSRMNDKEDPFPAAIKLSARCVVWDERQIDAWMARRAVRSLQPADLVDAMAAAS